MSSNPPIARREFVRATLGALAAAPFATGVFAQGSGALTDSIDFKRLVAANRILAREEIVDAFGHVSIRDPENPRRYVMARSRAPELVEHADLIRFEQDGRSLDPGARTPYGERMIHGAIYEARNDVNSVVHNHAYPLLPFSITGRALEPMVHVASVIGADVPIWISPPSSATPTCWCERWTRGAISPPRSAATRARSCAGTARWWRPRRSSRR